MRVVAQPLPGGFELCARLGLLLVPGLYFGWRIIHAVLSASPSARAGIECRDIVIAVNKTRWDFIRQLTFSDRRPSELRLTVFVARYFVAAEITVVVSPEPYRPIEDIVAEATGIAAEAQSKQSKITCVNPRFECRRPGGGVHEA